MLFCKQLLDVKISTQDDFIYGRRSVISALCRFGLGRFDHESFRPYLDSNFVFFFIFFFFYFVY